MIEWIWPWMFALLPLPLAVWLLLPAQDNPEPALRVPDLGLFRLNLRGQLGLPRHRGRWRTALLALAWLALVTAAARPQWTGDAISLPTSGRDLMLAVDISGSMGNEDMALSGKRTSRLRVVKAVVSDFVAARQGDRVGLILFGTNAYMQTPLTFDLASVNQLLQEAPVGIAGGKTAIGDAIGLAVKHLQDRPESQRILILLTDGASNAGAVAPLKAAELAASRALKIYTIGVGSDETQQRGWFGALPANPAAELDEDTLRGIAEQTGGRYFRARNTENLIEIYDLIDAMEPVEQEHETYRPIRALFHWPLGAAWLALLLAFQPLRFRRA